MNTTLPVRPPEEPNPSRYLQIDFHTPIPGMSPEPPPEPAKTWAELLLGGTQLIVRLKSYINSTERTTLTQEEWDKIIVQAKGLHDSIMHYLPVAVHKDISNR